jgi:hypothetical protein
MGLGFLSQKDKQVRKRWDRQRVRLSAPDLFGQLARSVKTVVVKPLNGFEFGQGQSFDLTLREGRFFAYHNRELVGICDDPSRSVMLAASEYGGKVLGIFQEMREHSGVAELIVCVEPEPTDDSPAEDHEKRYRTKTAP